MYIILSGNLKPSAMSRVLIEHQLYGNSVSLIKEKRELFTLVAVLLQLYGY